MKIYFLSSQPCALFLNELYYGITDKFERFIDVSLSDKIFARFSPQNALPLGFFLDERLLETPPQGTEIYLLKDGLLVYAKEFPPADLSLKVLCQNQSDDTLITVFRQGAMQLSIQSNEGYFNATLPPTFAAQEVFLHNGLCFLKSATHLAVYTKTAVCLFFEKVLSYSVEKDILSATLPLSDRLHRRAECTFTLSPTSCNRTSFVLQQDATLCSNEDLLPYAFFESILIGAEYKEFLSEELQTSADKIRSFLGAFKGVVLTDNPKNCGLIKERQERFFEVKYYSVTLNEGKIVDIVED